MHHVPTFLQSCLIRTFPQPSVTLRCAFRQLCRNASTLQYQRGVKESEAQLGIVRGRPIPRQSSCQQSWLSQLGISYQVRTYTSKPGEYGNLNEKDFKSHSSKISQLSLHEIRQVFGNDMTKKEGNSILTRVQKRRITGTLDHEDKAPSADAPVVARALKFLRKKYPLDEDAAIVKRIEREEGENEKHFITEAERLKKWHPQMDANPDNVYGSDSGVDEFAKMWNARQAAKIKDREERKRQYAELKANQEAARITDGRENPTRNELKVFEQTRAVWTGEAETSEWIKRYKEKGRLSDMLEPPKMSVFDRLAPSYILAAFVLIFCAFLAFNYTPPNAEHRIFPNVPVAFTTLVAITTINSCLYLAWKIPPLWRLMNLNFLHITATPKARTTVLAAFSHQEFVHLIGNMVGLWLIGLPLHEEVGRGAFMAIFLSGAVFGGVFNLTRSVLMNRLETNMLGASGAVCAVWAAWAWLPSRRDETKSGDDFKSFAAKIGRPDLDDHVTTLTKIVIIVLLLSELIKSRRPIWKMDHICHVGGYISGIFSAEILMWKDRRDKRKKALADLPPPPIKPHFMKRPV